MKKVTKTLIYLFATIAVFLIVITSCTKKDSTDTTPPASDPYAMFQYTIKSNGIVSFTNTSTYATSYLWDFGDGSTSTATTVNFDHQYSQNGTYKATLTAYGNGKSSGAYANLNITSVSNQTVTDVDGNIYHTVTIGTQVWMVENLKTTKYNDGTAIPLVTDGTEWSNLTTPGYCWYNNDAATYKNTYGALYNWFTVNTSKLAPSGWHVPTDAEWTLLASYLGGADVAGGKLKSTGTIEAGTGLYYSPNTGATNESGFTAIPAGGRDRLGASWGIGYLGRWWSSSECTYGSAWCRYLDYNGSDVRSYGDDKIMGYSVRCVRD